MLCKNEADLKKQLSLYGVPTVTLLGGNEPALVLAWQKQILSKLKASGADIERLDGKTLDIDALCGDASMVSMLGGARAFFLDGVDPAVLKSDANTLAELLADFPEGNFALVTLAPGILPKPAKGKTAMESATGALKKLIEAASRRGIAAALDKRTPAQLKNTLVSVCKKRGCELTPAAANMLLQTCGDDMGSLLHECEKLCFYRQSGEITAQDVAAVCPFSADGNMYSIASMMLAGNAADALGEIEKLLMKKTIPASGIIASLGIEFATLSRAAAARDAGKSAEELARDTHMRFNWKAKNAMRDIRRVSSVHLAKACDIFCDAEWRLKSSPQDERALLDVAVVSAMAILREGTR